MKSAFVFSLLFASAICSIAENYNEISFSDKMMETENPADLMIYEAGKNGKKGPKVTDGMTFDVNTFPSKTFSIVCAPSKDSVYAKFYINGELVKKENVVPYTIAGDWRGKINEWDSYPDSTFTIKCELSDGLKSTLELTIKDGTMMNMPMDNSDDDDNDDSGNMPPTSGDGNGCVVIDAKTTLTSPLSNGWTSESDGLAYKKNLNNKKAITRAGANALKYQFIAPKKSRFAFIIDMTTSNAVDFNDIWAKFNYGGFKLMRNNVSTGAKTGYIKVYHNANGRAQISSSVDHNPHSISTAKELKEGDTYTFYISGRSSKVTIHQIVIYPCSGDTCQRGTSWNDMLDTCLNM